jgi:hypothetical protein
MKIIQKIFKYCSVKPRIGVTLIALGIFVFAALPSNALAAYNPSYIMPDDVFVNSNSMSGEQIQAFLVAQGSYLASYTIPDSYTDSTGTFRGSWVGPVGREENAVGWSTAHLIAKVAGWYGINPQVILVTLQKEQSIITTTVSNEYKNRWAMGYAVTESGVISVCDTPTNSNPSGSCAGVAMQIDWGGGGLKYGYNCSINGQSCGASSTNGQPYVAGKTIGLAECSMFVGNHSTASLYRYTPHNTYGGNFRTNYTNWFGSIDYVGTTPVYRFLKSANNTHFYTASETEKINIMLKWPTIYKYEGVAYSLNNTSGKNDTPLYRFYNMQNSTHFYTASEAEKNNVISRWGYIYKYEGVAYNVCGDPASCTPVYRFWNINGTHFYTISEAEKNNVMARWGNIFKYEGVGYYISN